MLSPFPARRDLFLLAAGLVLGVVLGPPVLGSVSPAGYIALFGGTEAFAASERINEQADAARAQARTQLGLEPGFEPAPRSAEDAPADPDRLRAEAQYRQADRALAQAQNAAVRNVEGVMDSQAIRWLLGLLVALAGVFVAEVLVSPEPPAARGAETGSVVVPPALRRLVTVRYALLAVAMAVVLARATLYEGIPWPFAIVLLAVSLGAAWVPLGRGRSKNDPPDPVNPPAQAADAPAG